MPDVQPWVERMIFIHRNNGACETIGIASGLKSEQSNQYFSLQKSSYNLVDPNELESSKICCCIAVICWIFSISNEKAI
jgi:hypothetical protein